MSIIHQPNDKLFKLSMGDIHVAKEFFTSYLPKDILMQIDLDKLKLQKQSFIDEAYKTTEADIVYSTKLGDSSAYLYLLCEHQSEIDPAMAFRLLVYSMRIMEAHKKQYPRAELPIVYPLVIYTGEKIWDASLDIFSLFGEAELLARKYLFKPYQLLEVHGMSDNELRQQALFGLVAFAFKHRQKMNNEYFWQSLFNWICEIEQKNMRDTSLSKIVLNYVMSGNIKKESVEFIIQQAKESLVSSSLRGEFMTLQEHFLQQGIEQGMQQGMQQGVREGVKQGEMALLIQLLKRRFGDIPSKYLQLINQADNEELLNWGERLLEVDVLEKVFEECS